MFRHCEIMQQQDLQQDEIAVLRALVLFDTSHPLDIDHENPDQIHSLQMLFLDCFLHVLHQNRGPENATKVYCNVVRALTVSRTIQYMAFRLRTEQTDLFGSVKIPTHVAEVMSLPTVENLQEELTDFHINAESSFGNTA